MPSQSRARREWSDYTQAIHRTNETGLASVNDYRVAFGPLAEETRESSCAQVPVFAALERVGVPIGGVASLVMHPPGEPLPEALRESFRELEEVVTATTTQVLEARQSGGPRADAFSVGGRQTSATSVLALGEAEGDAIRRTVWERDGETWRHSEYIAESATNNGLTRDEYREFQQCLAAHLPPPGDPDVLAKARQEPASIFADIGASYHPWMSSRPWISFADISDLIDRQKTPNPRSDEVKSGQNPA